MLSSRPPYPIFWVLDTKKHMLHSIDARKPVYQGCPTQKNGHFVLKNGLKMPTLGLIHCFLGWGGQFQAPQPYFAGV